MSIVTFLLENSSAYQNRNFLRGRGSSYHFQQYLPINIESGKLSGCNSYLLVALCMVTKWLELKEIYTFKAFTLLRYNLSIHLWKYATSIIDIVFICDDVHRFNSFIKMTI